MRSIVEPCDRPLANNRMESDAVNRARHPKRYTA